MHFALSKSPPHLILSRWKGAVALRAEQFPISYQYPVSPTNGPCMVASMVAAPLSTSTFRAL